MLRPFLPLTHAVDAFRGTIATGGGSPAIDAVVLAAWLVVALLVALAGAAGAGRRAPAPGGLAAGA